MLLWMLVCVCVCVCMYVCVDIYIYRCVCMCVRVCVCEDWREKEDLVMGLNNYNWMFMSWIECVCLAPKDLLDLIPRPPSLSLLFRFVLLDILIRSMTSMFSSIWSCACIGPLCETDPLQFIPSSSLVYSYKVTISAQMKKRTQIFHQIRLSINL